VNQREKSYQFQNGKLFFDLAKPTLRLEDMYIVFCHPDHINERGASALIVASIGDRVDN
jgi:hypothetical protein